MNIFDRITTKFYSSEFFRRMFVNELATQDIQSMQLITSLLPDNCYIPYTSYSLSPTAIAHIINEIILLKRTTIVEFGSGVSTIILARLISLHNLDTTLYSVDHDLEWHDSLENILKVEDIDRNVKLIRSEIAPVSNAGAQSERWYSKEALDAQLPDGVDLVIVDGPTYSVGALSRYHAVPYLKEKLAASYTIFLDDTFRRGEKQILIEWSKLLNISPVEFIRYALFTTNKTISTIPISNSYNYKYKEHLKANERM